ncbi:MAG: VCBS repeat-containing protein, partial [Candidatus Methylomirabilales bacterium]
DPIVLATGDFNEDGIPDLALIFASLNAAGIYRGDGKGGFAPTVERERSGRPLPIRSVADTDTRSKGNT